jgi:hypothetical protein
VAASGVPVHHYPGVLWPRQVLLFIIQAQNDQQEAHAKYAQKSAQNKVQSNSRLPLSELSGVKVSALFGVLVHCLANG